MPRKHPLPFSVLCWISVTSWGFSKKLQEMLGDDWLSLGWPEGIQTTPFIPMYLRTISITLKITYNLSKFVYFMTCPLGFTKKIEMMFLWRSMCFWRCQFGPGSGGSAPQCHPNCKAHPGCCLGTTHGALPLDLVGCVALKSSLNLKSNQIIGQWWIICICEGSIKSADILICL